MLWLTVVVAIGIQWLISVSDRYTEEQARIEALSDEKWRCDELSRMIESQGYGVTCGPGRNLKLRSPQGWAISSDGSNADR